MTRAQAILASRLMDRAAEEFHEHGCNDMDPETFEDLTEEELSELEKQYNDWKRGETAETCGDPEDDFVKLAQIRDDEWMCFLAQRIGNDLFQKELVAALKVARRWMMDKERVCWPQNRAEVELVDMMLAKAEAS